jgi:type IX secretion system PorP/SprF family membrane protein
MKKIIIAIAGLLSLNNFVQAQIEPMYGMYRFNALVVNPAQAGANRSSDLSLLTRWQWTAIDGAPKTHSLSLNLPVRQNLGFGVNLVSDNIGPVSDFYLSTDYAYQLPISKRTKISAGLRLSVINHRVDLASRSLVDQVDESFKTNLNSGFRVNPGLGFLIMNPKYFVGFSMPRLLKYSYGSIKDVSQYKDVQHSFIYAGYIHQLNREIVLRPSFISNMSVDAPLSFDVNVMATFKSVIDAGLVYRKDDAIGLLLGYKFGNGLYAGYSYEYPVSDIRKVSYMTHELALRFAIKDYSNKRILTPRYFN